MENPVTGPGITLEPTVNNEKPAKQKMVTITIPMVPGVLEEDVIVGINGVNYQIPRGKPEKVPEFVAKEYERGERAMRQFHVNASKRLLPATGQNVGQVMY